MKTIRSSDFRADRAWGAEDVSLIEGASVRLHWTDQPYKWHTNDGQEVFVVVAGSVDMHYREKETEKCVRLAAGDIFVAENGDAHFASPIGEARIIVIEKLGSA